MAKRGTKKTAVVEETTSNDGPLSVEQCKQVVELAKKKRDEGTIKSRVFMIRDCLNELVLDNSEAAVDQVDGFWLTEYQDAVQQNQEEAPEEPGESATPAEPDTTTGQTAASHEEVGAETLFAEPPKKKMQSSTLIQIQNAHAKLRDAVKAAVKPLGFLIFDKESRNKAKKEIDTRAETVLDACTGMDRYMQILLTFVNRVVMEFPAVPVEEMMAEIGLSNQPGAEEQEVINRRQYEEAEAREKAERAEKKANRDLDRMPQCEGQLSIHDALKEGTAEAASECVTSKLFFIAFEEEGKDIWGAGETEEAALEDGAKSFKDHYSRSPQDELKVLPATQTLYEEVCGFGGNVIKDWGENSWSIEDGIAKFLCFKGEDDETEEEETTEE